MVKISVPGIALMIMMISSCLSFDFNCPYNLDLSKDREGVYDVSFENDTYRTVKSVGFSFIFTDDTIEEVVIEREMFSYTINRIRLNIHDFVLTDDEDLTVDALYVSFIEYEDGSVWRDESGMFCTYAE